MADRFAGQVVIVTGGSRGIGRAIVEGLAAEGAQVIVVGLSARRGQETVQEISQTGGQVTFLQADVSQQKQVEALIAQILNQYDHINVLINNAAIHQSAPFCEESAESWHRLFQVNVMGTVFSSQAVVRHMQLQGGGSIVHIASKAGVVGEPDHAAYSASKGAIISLTRAMAIELAPYAIRVNAVCPGPVLTDMLRTVIPVQKARNALAAETPLGRIGKPEDITGAVLYLASSDSSWCTGQVISIDGGLSILK